MTQASRSRVRHPGRLVAFVIAVAVLLAGAFIAGLFISSPTDDALEQVDSTVPVFAKVEERVVDDGFVLPATVVPPAQLDLLVGEASQPTPVTKLSTDGAAVVPPPQTISDRVVVSRAVLQAGEKLTYGSLIAEVSGRPLIAWPSIAPRYRDLAVGDAGADVRALQQVLSDLGQYRGAVDGKFGAETLKGLARLYRGVGYDVPSVREAAPGFAWREFLSVPTGDAQVVGVAATGTVLDTDTPVARVATTVPVLQASATAREISAMQTGAEVRVSVAGASAVPSTVLEAGEFTTDEKTGASGYPVTIAIPAGVTIGPDAIVQISPPAANKAGPAVPAVAIRQEGATAYVLVRSEDAPNGVHRVDVKALSQGSGWVSLDPASAPKVGTEVLLSDG